MSSSDAVAPTRRAILDALASGPIDGPTLAERLDITRAAVWKHVDGLREAGFAIESGDAGYVVTDVPEYGGEAVAFGLEPSYEIVYRDVVESTNDCARSLAIDGARDVVVLADAQSAGRGRLGRDWTGPSGGIYLSVVLTPDLAPAAVPAVTLAAAVATVRALPEELDAGIKWPNDVHTPTGKVAGVLTEMEGEADRVSWVIVGIGINANVSPGELPAGATSLQADLGEPVNRRRIVQSLLAAFDELVADPTLIVPAWKQHARTLGLRVRVNTPTATVEGTAVDVEPPGHLRIDTGDDVVTVHAGDCEHLRPAE